MYNFNDSDNDQNWALDEIETILKKKNNFKETNMYLNNKKSREPHLLGTYFRVFRERVGGYVYTIPFKVFKTKSLSSGTYYQ